MVKVEFSISVPPCFLVLYGRMKKICLFALGMVIGLGITWCASLRKPSVYEPRAGDLVFQALDRGVDLVVAIEGVTKSDYSHVGVLLRRDGKWMVFEARSNGVKAMPFSEWKTLSRKGRWAAYRVKATHQRHLAEFLAALQPHAGKAYDFKYELSDDSLYCSELVYHAWRKATGQRMGQLARLGDLNWKPYQPVIEKYNGGPVVLDRQIISPVALSRAEQLERVYNHGLDR